MYVHNLDNWCDYFVLVLSLALSLCNLGNISLENKVIKKKEFGGKKTKDRKQENVI